ncbi:MAG TPA: RidA family protein [Mycobacterium sp.]|nr:RidA family protein [Mycobacterium sp.]
MTITRINPERLHQTAGYAHVTLVESTQLAVLAGQCPLDPDGQLVGRGDVVVQANQVIANALEALAAAGASPVDVVKSVIYVVSDDPGVLAAIWTQLGESELAPAFSTASTLLGVSALGYANQLIEIDLTAALPT